MLGEYFLIVMKFAFPVNQTHDKEMLQFYKTGKSPQTHIKYYMRAVTKLIFCLTASLYSLSRIYKEDCKWFWSLYLCYWALPVSLQPTWEAGLVSLILFAINRLFGAVARVRWSALSSSHYRLHFEYFSLSAYLGQHPLLGEHSLAYYIFIQ